MKAKFQQVFRGALAALTLGTIAWLCVRLWQWNASLPQHLSAPIVTVFVTVTGWGVARHIERRREVERQQRDRKIPAYEALLRFVFSAMASGKQSDRPDPNAEQQRLNDMAHSAMTDLNPQVIAWASDSVLQEYISWRTQIVRLSKQQDAVSGIMSLLHLGDLVLAIRKDVGHENKNITNLDVLRAFINDIDSVLLGELEKRSSSGGNSED